MAEVAPGAEVRRPDFLAGVCVGQFQSAHEAEVAVVDLVEQGGVQAGAAVPEAALETDLDGVAVFLVGTDRRFLGRRVFPCLARIRFVIPIANL